MDRFCNYSYIMDVEKMSGNIKYLPLHLNYHLECQGIEGEHNDADEENIG